jgi:hypothetical protein
MNPVIQNTSPHPDFLDLLFTYNKRTHTVFKDVMGLYNIDHIALSYINRSNQLIAFSSTPSLEFNLFSKALWLFDKTYQTEWYRLCNSATWPSLYAENHFDELYYQKQIRHHYPTGVSLAIKSNETYIIYSIASHKDDPETQNQFDHHQHDFYKIGEYCSNSLHHLMLSHADYTD